MNQYMTRFLYFAFFLFGSFLFSSLVFAEPPTITFNPTPATEYNVYEGGMYDVVYDLSEIQGEDVDMDFFVKGPLGHITEMEFEIDSHWVIANDQKTFGWDGMFAGGYPLPGTYELRIQGTDLFANDTNVLMHEFEVTEESNITVNDAPTVYSITSGNDYEIDFSLETVVPACIVLRVDGELIEFYGPLNTGDHTASWNGDLGGGAAAEGDYDWRMYADSGYCGGDANTNDLATGTVTVTTDEAPALSDLGMTIDPFSPDDDGNQDTTTVTFDLSNDADVTISVLNENEVEVRKLKDAEATSAGTVNAVWDGEESGGSTVPNSEYTVHVMVENDAGTDEDKVTVEVMASDEEPEPELINDDTCAEFTDVPADHPDCDALEYVQSIGAMTGYGDGTFGPGEILQRDQIAKISLEAFGLFDENQDYCDGNPFPDVTGSAWSQQYICRGVDLEMITGYQSGADAGLYRPARSVNRIEFLALILRNVSDDMPAAGTSYNDASDTSQWYFGYGKYSYDNSLFVGNSLYPTQLVTRGEVAKVLYKLSQLGKI